jgi:hypothetical protein
MVASLMLVVAALAAVGAGEQRPTFAKPSGDAARASATLDAARNAADDAQRRERAVAALELLGRESPAGERLAAALTKSAADGTADLRGEIAAVYDELSFEPLREAELPAGFPTYTPVGAIEVKTYPKNRRAVANNFMTLFFHITANNSAMTTPVRMEFAKTDEGKLKQQSMAFYYGSTETGELGKKALVTAIEDEGSMVVALGMRGSMSREAMAAGDQRLRQWLAAHPEYAADGDLIVMGYNSPMVPRKESFMEVQLPVRKVGETPAE